MKTALIAVVVAVPFLGEIRGQMPDAPDVSNVQITVSTNLGVAIQRAKVMLTSVGPRKKFEATGGISRFDQIPYGLYDLEVQLVGFKVRRERIAVYQPNLAFRIGLELGYPSPSERSELLGSIKPAPQRALNMWIRLVPLYAGTLIENAVNTNGRFNIVSVPPAKYVLLLFDGDDLLTVQPVDFKGGIQSVDIMLPQTHSLPPK